MKPLCKAIRAAGVFSCLLTAAVTVQGGIIDDNANDQDHQNLANQSAFDAVGVAKRLNAAGTSIVVDSSGILIGSQWVLTAAHTAIAKGWDGATFEVGGEVRDVVETYQNPNFVDIENGWDIALLKLDSPITSVTPAQLYTGTAESLVGEELVYVGYGKSGTGSTGDTIAAGTKRAGYNVGNQLGYTLNPGTGQTVYSSQIIFADMDAEPGGGLPYGNPLGSTFPLNLEILIALGDSGGGLFVEQGGQYYVAGVHSVLFNMDPVSTIGYGDVMGSTTIAAALDWINDIMAPDPIEGDLNGDGFVGLDDIDIVLTFWNQSVTVGDLLSGDPSGDGFVGLDDLDIILNNWNSGTAPTASQLLGIVPEPTTALLLLAVMPGLLQRRR